MLFVNPAAFTPDIEFAPSGGARLTLILATLACYVAAVWLVLNKTLSRELRLFALLWLCLVVPTHSIVPKLDALTARPFSASLAPLLGLVACGVVHWLSRVPKWWPVASLALVGALAVLFPVTLRRARLYQDPIALWTDAAARTTRSVRPLINLGTLLAQRGQLHEAQSALTQALQRDPTRYDTRFRLLSVRRAMLHAPSPTGN
jgi:tetratricopeptide (TPR) repeat protein